MGECNNDDDDEGDDNMKTCLKTGNESLRCTAGAVQFVIEKYLRSNYVYHKYYY